MWARTLILLIATALPYLGQKLDPDRFFRYYVFDQTKTDALNYEFVRDCSVYVVGGQPPHMSFYTEYRVAGCHQKSFTYQEERNEYQLTREEYAAFLEKIHRVDLGKLRRTENSSCTNGILNISDKDYYFTNPLGTPERDALQTAVLDLLKTAPQSKRESKKQTIEGDFEPAHEVTVAQLLSEPTRYDGKRVRITGFYHSEFEDSSLFDKKGDDFQKAVWVDNSSSFASGSDLHWTDDGHTTIEGTFMNGPGGHMGTFAGEIQRITKFISLDPPAPPPPPANQSSKRK